MADLALEPLFSYDDDFLDCLETASTASETSAAVVSLYNTWASSTIPTTSQLPKTVRHEDCSVSLVSSSSSTSLSHKDEEHSLKTIKAPSNRAPRVSLSSLSSMSERSGATAAVAPSVATVTPPRTTSRSSNDLLKKLKKRLRDEDIPAVPVLRRRKYPVCRFLNHFGKRHNSEEGQQQRLRTDQELENQKNDGSQEVAGAATITTSSFRGEELLLPSAFLRKAEEHDETDENEEFQLDLDEQDVLFPFTSSKMKHLDGDDYDDHDFNLAVRQHDSIIQDSSKKLKTA